MKRIRSLLSRSLPFAFVALVALAGPSVASSVSQFVGIIPTVSSTTQLEPIGYAGASGFQDLRVRSIGFGTNATGTAGQETHAAGGGIGFRGVTPGTDQIKWGTGGSFSVSSPEILFPTDQDGFILSANGRAITTRAGDATINTNPGGNASLIGGVGLTSGAGGNTSCTGGQGGGTGTGGSFAGAGGTGGTASGNGGPASVTGGAASGGGVGGLASLVGGAGSGTNQASGGVTIDMGNSTGNATETILFKGPPTGASGAGVNTSVTLMTLNNDGGLTLGAPTGGDKGAGTLNVAGNLYVNGSAVATGTTTLQSAYNGGNSITTAAATPVQILTGAGVAGLVVGSTTTSMGGVQVFSTLQADDANKAAVDYTTGTARFIGDGPDVNTNAKIQIVSQRSNGSNGKFVLSCDVTGAFVGVGTNAPAFQLDVPSGTTRVSTLRVETGGIQTPAAGGVTVTDGSGNAQVGYFKSLVCSTSYSSTQPTNGFGALGVIGFLASAAGAVDTAASRVSPNVMAVGNGGASDASGTLRVTTVQAPAAQVLSLGGAATNQLVISGGTSGATTATLTQPNNTAGAPTALLINGGAHTTLAASVEAPLIYVNNQQTVQFSTGAQTIQRAIRIQPPTYAFVGASTITTCAVLGIDGPSAAGTNATITNNWIAAFGTTTAGNVALGNATGSNLAQSATSGFPYIPQVATGAPSGTPTTITGAVPMTIGGDNKLYWYAGGSWMSASGTTPTLGSVVNAGNVVNSVAASGQFTWTTGGTYAAGSTSEIYGPTDTGFFISAGSPTAGAGNGVTVTASNAFATSGSNGGIISVKSGAGDGAGTGGTYTLQAGAGGTTGVGGAITIQAGSGGGTSGTGGALTIRGGSGVGATSGAGGLLTLAGGLGAANSNNNAAGGVTISTGTPSGNATAHAKIQTGFTGASGAVAQTMGDRFFVSGTTFTLPNAGTATTFVQLNVPTSGSVGGCTVFYMVEANDGTDFSSVTGTFTVSASNKAGTVTATAGAIVGSSNNNTGAGESFTTTSSVTITGTAVNVRMAEVFTVISPTTVRISYTLVPFGNGVTVTPQ